MAKRKRFGRVRRYYARGKSRAKKMTIPIAPLAGIMAMPATSLVASDLTSGQYGRIPASMATIAGFNNGVFSIDVLKNNMIPLLTGMLVHKGANILGVNRTLAAAKVPLIRI